VIWIQAQVAKAQQAEAVTAEVKSVSGERLQRSDPDEQRASNHAAGQQDSQFRGRHGRASRSSVRRVDVVAHLTSPLALSGRQGLLLG
jgi:hypothetical protein